MQKFDRLIEDIFMTSRLDVTNFIPMSNVGYLFGDVYTQQEFNRYFNIFYRYLDFLDKKKVRRLILE